MTSKAQALADAHVLERGTGRVAIVKKHPDGYYCLYDSKGKRPLNCFDKQYTSEKPPKEKVLEAERIVQHYKHL